MSEHTVVVNWSRQTEGFSLASYNRSHQWDFGHEVKVAASAAPDYRGDIEMVDPEQAFTASVASCHMLTFLAIASQKGFVVDDYQDQAIGRLGQGEQGTMLVSDITLKPQIRFSGDSVPTEEQLQKLHDAAHQHCFIANSVKTRVHVEVK
mgnify:CR=1 FL=1